MKKLLAFSMVVILVLSLAACGGNKPVEDNDTVNTATTTTEGVADGTTATTAECVVDGTTTAPIEGTKAPTTGVVSAPTKAPTTSVVSAPTKAPTKAPTTTAVFTEDSTEANTQNTTIGKNEEQIVPPASPLKWCAMGDSITQGWYSYYDADGNVKSTPNASIGWAYQVANMNGYELTNKAIGGSGYIRSGGEGSAVKNGKEVADATDFAEYDLVTLAFGVNDWKYNCVLGSMNDDVDAGTSMYSNMRYIIEKILTDNPTCKIIVITPINCMLKGTYESNWGLGYAFTNNGTLEDIFNAIVEVCEWYGIEHIDMTHNSVVNKDNISEMLIDKVHPSKECHKAMAQELAKRIHY